MLNKIINFSKLFWRKDTGNGFFRAFFIIVFISIIVSSIINNVYGNTGVICNAITISVGYSYLSILTKFKMCDLLPISNKAIVRYTYLTVFINMIIIYFISVTFPIAIIMTMVAILSLFNINFESGEAVNYVASISMEGILLIVIILLIAALFTITVAFIRNKIIRIVGLIGIVTVVFSAGLAMKSYVIGVVGSGFESILQDFNLLPNSTSILCIGAIIFLILIPINIKIADKIYANNFIVGQK